MAQGHVRGRKLLLRKLRGKIDQHILPLSFCFLPLYFSIARGLLPVDRGTWRGPLTVASFRTWRGSQCSIARDRSPPSERA